VPSCTHKTEVRGRLIFYEIVSLYQMKNIAIKPMEAFWSWLHTLPVSQQQHLARMFFLCTTDNSADFALAPDEALVRLKYYITADDFLLRRLSRLIILRTIFDFILSNRQRFEAMDRQLEAISHTGDRGAKVARLSEKQWERTLASWRRFRNSVLTDWVIYSYLRD